MAVSRGKIIVGLALIVGALGYVGITAARSGWVYLQEVDAFARSAPRPHQRARVYGVVGAGADARPVDLHASFELTGHEPGGPAVRVCYHGAVPDGFRVGHEVVVEGALDDAGVFQADVLMTKCASKYERKPTTARATETRE